jgi:hypothetical protein
MKMDDIIAAEIDKIQQERKQEEAENPPFRQKWQSLEQPAMRINRARRCFRKANNLHIEPRVYQGSRQSMDEDFNAPWLPARHGKRCMKKRDFQTDSPAKRSLTPPEAGSRRNAQRDCEQPRAALPEQRRPQRHNPSKAKSR